MSTYLVLERKTQTYLGLVASLWCWAYRGSDNRGSDNRGCTVLATNIYQYFHIRINVYTLAVRLITRFETMSYDELRLDPYVITYCKMLLATN